MIRHRRSSILAILAVAVGMSGVTVAVPAAASDHEPVYYLPAPAETELIVTAGNGDTDGRSSEQEYAFTFVAADEPVRFPVVAARGGTVIRQRLTYKNGRCNKPLDGPRPACWREVNHVLIDHGDGTSGLYLHLQRGEPTVRRGDVVSAGQHIGNAGRSGWTSDVQLAFQVQETPPWIDRGQGGWFLTQSIPVEFADSDVLRQRGDGVPHVYDSVISGNPPAAFEPFRFERRPTGLPASVPFAAGTEHDLSAAYEADSSDGYGLSFEVPAEALDEALEPGDDPVTEVRPLFGGTLAFAGCAAGASAPLGRTVAIELEVGETPYLGVLGHLSRIEPELLEMDPASAASIIAPNDVVGHVGLAEPVDEDAIRDCPGADPADGELFATILRDAVITPDGEISGGTPVSPEPLVGELGYEGFAWWRGPVTAVEVSEEPGRPRARWNEATPASGSHIPFGRTVLLKTRVRDITDIAAVRFLAYYDDWPQVDRSIGLESFDPAASWREIASCAAPSDGRVGGDLCTWKGDGQDARVTFVWDPSTTPRQDTAPWLPPARRAISRAATECVAVSLAVEVIDGAGHVYSQVSELPRPVKCDDRAAQRAAGARVLYLDPLVPPPAPVRRSSPNWRNFAPRPGEDADNGWVRWKDRADNEDGYRVYARRAYFTEDCDIAKGPWVLIEDLPADTRRYQPRHTAIIRKTPVTLPDAPGELTGYELYVSAFNRAGESKRVFMGTFQKERGFFCDTGILEPPPDL